jgi:hypothetical protein
MSLIFQIMQAMRPRETRIDRANTA